MTRIHDMKQQMRGNKEIILTPTRGLILMASYSMEEKKWHKVKLHSVGLSSTPLNASILEIFECFAFHCMYFMWWTNK